MKKIQSAFIGLTLILLSLDSNAQMVGGQGGTGNSNMPAQSNTDNKGYLDIAANFPMGMWSQNPSASHSIADSYNQLNGFGAGTGISLEWGNIFYFHNITNLPQGYKLGLNASWIDFSYIPIASGWETLGGQFTNANYYPFYMLGSKIGILGTYNLSGTNNVDAYFNLFPSYTFAGGMTNQVTTNDSYLFSATSGGFGLRTSMGVNFRHGALLVGLELVMGGYNLNTTINIQGYNTTSGVTTISNNTVDSHFSATTLRLKLGFAL